ncbi:MAG: ThiF family adenylyltransferase [Pseudomonadota bacterium]|nr:ThiF family adenylyltransferase [Pseudomonadota bacterium]
MRLNEDLKWHSYSSGWLLHVMIDTGLASTTFVPNPSAWHIWIDPAYPQGAINVYPAAEGGLVHTFPHMEANEPPRPKWPCRRGKLCLVTPQSVFARLGDRREPSDANERLFWHLQRAVSWVSAAASNTLLQPGDPFELPRFVQEDERPLTVAHQENARTFGLWQKTNPTWGIATLAPAADRADLLAIKEFLDEAWRPLVTYTWGDAVGHVDTAWAAWLRLPDLPVLPPWKAPRTWAQLVQTCATLGLDWAEMIDQMAWMGRRRPVDLLLLGFPVSGRVGEAPTQLTWQAIRLPRIGGDTAAPQGFRPNRYGRRQQVHLAFAPGATITWQPTYNWDAAVLGARGRYAEPVRTSRALLIGVGAVGAPLGEMLVRGGMQDLDLVDPDRLEAGNLVRHTLALMQVRASKASALASRLGRLAPFARVRAFPVALPTVRPALARVLTESDLVIDCTAEDEVLATLSTYADGRIRRYVSISVGWQARRLYFFFALGKCFPADAFAIAYAPWAEREAVDQAKCGCAADAPGCWHPLFPARYDATILLVAAAAQMIERACTGALAAGLHVLECRTDANGLPGLRQVTAQG